MSAEKVTHIGDRPDDERSSSRAISEILVRLGAVEGELHTLRAAIRAVDSELEQARSEFRQSVRSVRTTIGRATAAAERIGQAQDLVRAVARRLDLLDRGSVG